MSLIDTSYFIGPLTIAQLGKGTVDDTVQGYIDQYEPEFLTAALGYDLYQALTAGLAASPVDSKWTDLTKGKVFFNNYSYFYRPRASFYTGAQNVQWVGLKSTNPAQPSPVAAYVWIKYMRDLNTQVTGVGVVKSQADAASVARPDVKETDIWNRMVDSVATLWSFLGTSGTAVYPQYNSAYFDYGLLRRQNVLGI